MNPQERAVIDGIFDRLKSVANQPRDAEAERYIADLVRQQPYAPYALAQSTYVQEQALLNQQQQIEQLQAEVARLQQAAQAQPAPQQGGFLSGLFGGGAAAPAPRQAETPAYGQRNRDAAPPAAGPWGGQAQAAAPQAGPWGGQPQQPPQRQGMGFLGTAAAAAAGVAGGMMIGNILSGAFGGGSAHAATQGQGGHNLLGQNQGASQQAQGAEPGGYQNEDEEGYDDAGDDGYYDDGGGDSYEA